VLSVPQFVIGFFNVRLDRDVHHAEQITRCCISQWFLNSDQPTTPTIIVHAGSWRRLDMVLFRSRLTSSVLCQPSSWPSDVDEAASLCDDVISRIPDEILPTRRPRPSHP